MGSSLLRRREERFALVSVYVGECSWTFSPSSTLSTAFDAINLGVLLTHLFDLGVGRSVLHWYHSLLLGSPQKVVLKGSGSSLWLVAFRAPQGTILTALLSNLYETSG